MIPYFKAEALDLGIVAIQPFGLFAGGATVFFYFRCVYAAEKFGLDKEKMESLVLWIILTSLAMAHWVDVIAYQPEILLTEPWRLLYVWEDLSSFGGFLGTFVGAFIYCRWIGRVPLLPYADAIGRFFPAVWALARTGCFLVHDHPGTRSGFFLAVDYPGGGRHDLGFYELLLALGITALFWCLGRRKRFTGFFIGLLTAIYSPIRFGLDFLRLPETALPGQALVGDRRYLSLTPAQFGAIILFSAGALVLLLCRRGHWTRGAKRMYPEARHHESERTS